MNLVESMQRNKDDRVRWLEEAEEAIRLVTLLPKEIQELEGKADCDSDMKLKINLYGGDSALETCLEVGAIFDTPHLGYMKAFAVSGKLNDVSISIINLSVPPQCHIEKIPYTTYKYEAICDDTGERINSPS